MYKELLYDMVIGQSIYGSLNLDGGEKIEIHAEFIAEYERLYEEIYRAKSSIEERLAEEENEDIEKMLDNFLQINRMLSFKMYDIAKKIYSNGEC